MGVCVRSMSKQSKAASEVDYTPYSSNGQYESTASKCVVGLNDRKLAHSAQMFHYQHQKQQMLELERLAAATFFTCICTYGQK